MSFFLASENGFVSDLATAKGWADVVEVVDAKLPAISPLADLCNSGTTTYMQEVINDINKLLPSVDKDVRSTLEGLKSGLQKCKEIAIVSQ